MSLYEQFIDFSKKNGANMENLYHDVQDDYELVSFGENAPKDNNLLYNITLVFYDEEDVVEIFIRKDISAVNELEILKILNECNLKYRGVSFIYLENTVCLKSFCLADNNILLPLKLLAKNLEVAQTEFKQFKI